MTSTAPAARTDGDWDVEALDLDAYLARISYDGPRDPSLETLRRIHRAHVDAISWETLDLLLGREVDLRVPGLQEKMVERGRGGGCIEHNLLLAAALERLGFPVVRYMARVIRGVDRIRLRAHAVLKVEAEGGSWLADVGFGDEGLLEPIPFAAGATVTVGSWRWRLDEHDGDWLLRCLHHDGWFDVYSLREEVHHLVDFQVATFWICHNKPFAGLLAAQRAEDHDRHVLVNHELTTTHPDGSEETRRLGSREVVGVLRSTFRLTVPDDDAELVVSRLEEIAEQQESVAL